MRGAGMHMLQGEEDERLMNVALEGSIQVFS
jgi:hypothetical protein